MPRISSKFSPYVDFLSSMQPASAAHVLWLCQRRPLGENMLQLKRGITKQGLSIEVQDVFDWPSLQFTKTDLILLDAFERLDGAIETIVARIRLESRVPIVMLTDGYSTEQLVAALAAGADAIWALNTPVSVLTARCRAMLRRQSYATLNVAE